MKNMTAVITGANSGIGKVTAESLASQGAHLALVVRSRDKGERLLHELKEKTGNPHIKFHICHLDSLADVRRLAFELIQAYPVIDVLVNNAGAINDKRITTVDGYELTFAANHLAPFLLTNLLLDNLKASPAARVVNLASEAQRMGRINFRDLNYTRGYRSFSAYSQSKLANIMFTYELSDRLKGTHITVNAIHPGTVKTRFGEGLTGISPIIFRMFSPVMRNAQKGAETVIWLATSGEVQGVTGKYFHDKKEIKSIPRSYDPGILKKLWQVSEEMTGLAGHQGQSGS